jgi:type IV secretion system protein VirB6
MDVMVLAIAEYFMSAGGQWLDALLRPLAASIGDLAYYALIYDFIHDQIQTFGLNLMGRVSALVGVAALALMTIWVFFQGLRIMTGQSRDSLMALVVNSLKATLIVTAATTFGIAGPDAHDFLTQDLQNAITSVVTGDASSTAKGQIDKSLAWMQVGLTSIDVLQIVNDPTLHAEKTQAMWMVGVGTAGPPMVGGAMLLMYEVAMALFVGLGPIFILCLLFDATKSLFQRWLMYGIGTMFSMAVLAAMVAIATKVVLATAGAFWVSSLAGKLIGIGGSTGMKSIALQEGGIGLLLTLLIVSTPPMVANFFQGTLGNFSPYATLGGGGSSSSSPGSRPGEAGYQGGGNQGGGYVAPTTARADSSASRAGDSQSSNFTPAMAAQSQARNFGSTQQSSAPEQIKSASQMSTQPVQTGATARVQESPARTEGPNLPKA